MTRLSRSSSKAAEEVDERGALLRAGVAVPVTCAVAQLNGAEHSFWLLQTDERVLLVVAFVTVGWHLGRHAAHAFECYHVSRQSFLYLREFYIGELSPEDRLRVPPPNEQQRRGLTVQASAAFLEQLKRATPWRLRPEDMDAPTVFKSF